MKLIVIGSNSGGNAYLLKSASSTLLVETGMHIKHIKKALGFNLSGVHAIVSHCHGDHACAIKDVMNAGIDVYASQETFEAKGVEKHHRAKLMLAGKNYQVGEFKVKPFEVNHDVHCFGFLISHPECGLTLFLTDTFYCDYTFPGLNNIIVECNHDVELLQANNPRFLQERIVQSHMNLQTCKDLLLANDLSQVNNIVLIHLSDSNSDAKRFKSEIEKATGKMVHVAELGYIIENFNKQPF